VLAFQEDISLAAPGVPIQFDSARMRRGSEEISLKRVYSAETLVQVVHVQNLLAANGIVAELRNARLGGAVGEIPFLETWPQLWVAEPVFDHAMRVIESRDSQPAEASEPWRCAGCGETIEAQFSHCWNCGAASVASS